ncbi:hypothetical protein DMN77_23040 [Paenibacillus sp. 79R4]|uniref:hypothetical protein n=1 Tax=Paenibacillus sp. 79R4 TaxID=2212847 RepID=UPI0015BD3134|nr:hypothetical protein [Paenibacillus sp. 79R4]NWL90431.1 hypothetical protein [Paenibacillus sp. 79R4]
MKKTKRFKLSIMTLLTVFLLSLGASSAFAAYGWADTMETAQVMYNPTSNNSSFSSTIRLDGPSDSDFYVVDNTYGSYTFSFSVVATPPSNFDIVLAVIKMNANDDILYIDYNNYNGKGYPELISMGVKPGERVYFRVMSDGQNNYDEPYTITFTKTS